MTLYLIALPAVATFVIWIAWLALGAVIAAEDTPVRWSTVYVPLDHNQIPAPTCPPMWAGVA